MRRNKDETPAVRVYTVCDESKYLIVRNVPALGCGDELRKLFGGYGEIDEFAKRKLDESIFIGNRIQVSYAPQYESLDDTKEKLEGRRKEVVARLTPGRSKGPYVSSAGSTPSHNNFVPQPLNIQQSDPRETQRQHTVHSRNLPSMVSSNQDYFPVESMNQTVRLVREKLNKIESDVDALKAGSSKRPRNDNRRRI
ncbi:RNA-binding protein 48 isoform X2 [Helianthus annuus]|uniref:RNA-binding protein 48 isoform X2 n=1 Tax=Helianthus annuus TaxID=4232 RepID=UPI000B904674|nr:RNA-binding protein 48 isoform X2 [Helianthus annuus]XP_035836475.1 RNA-binding protein 48 isoform X2 [Helianthus annuus]